MTDVNIAVRLLADAIDDAFDIAMVVSADSDLIPPVEAVPARFPSKRIIIASSSARHSTRLAAAANGCFTIGRKKLQDSQLPNQITKPDGFVPGRLASWT
ncbi:NYN domain-containing protein [Xanthomonas sp. WHRI 7065]|uniref:NYN domain-containing protein n=1 Tax=Xanthomonas sp. WHRI 7065 TaxID=3161569 RepID=UPI0032E8EC2C